MKDVGVRYSYALNDGKERVSIQNAKKGETYTCQLCGNKMIPKKGNIKRWHYAHKMDVGCDVWYRNKGEWHIEMQEKFDEDCREVVVTTEDGEKHIADVCIEKPCGQKLVIEFQNSPMTAEEFKERTNFWKNKVGADIIWVFNFKQDDPKSQNRFQEIPDGRILREYAGKNHKYYRWKNPSIPFSDLKHDVLVGQDYADIIRSVPAFIESVPIIFYMNAEEKTEWKKYERYKTSSITGRFNETPFYLKLCGISPKGMTQDINRTYETHLNGYDLIYGEKYGYSWFKTYIERERYPMMVAGKFCELEEIPLEKKALEYIEVLKWIYSKVIKGKITNEKFKDIQYRLDKAKREYRDTGNPEIKGIHEYELKIAEYYRRIERFSPEVFAAIVAGVQTKTTEPVQKPNQETTTSEKSVKAQETIRKSTEEESTKGQTKKNDHFAQRKELIQMLKEKLEEENRLADNLEGEIEKDPIKAYKRYSKMIRDGKFGDEHVIEKVARRLTILYRAEVLTTDINNLAEFFEVFETQLLHEMPEYRRYCKTIGCRQNRVEMIGYLRQKYWDDQAAQAEAERLRAETIPDVVKVLLNEDGTLKVTNPLKGLDMTSGLPFMN